MGTGVNVGTGVKVGAGVGVTVGVGVGVGVGTGVGVAVGSGVAVGTNVGVAAGTGDDVGTGVTVTVGAGVTVAVAVAVGSSVGARVGTVVAADGTWVGGVLVQDRIRSAIRAGSNKTLNWEPPREKNSAPCHSRRGFQHVSLARGHEAESSRSLRVFVSGSPRTVATGTIQPNPSGVKERLGVGLMTVTEF